MTCIAGVVHKGHVYLGADSRGVDSNYGKNRRLDAKLFKLYANVPTLPRGQVPFIFGFTTSFRMGQLLQYRLDLPDLAPSRDIHAYLCTDFVDAVRKVFSDGGFGKSGDEGDKGGEFLVGVQGRLFKVQCDFQVEETADAYTACGCGEDLALGSLFVTRFDPPRSRLVWALHAASHHNAGVAGPFAFIDTEVA